MKFNRDQIKYLAAFTMLLNHIANLFLVKGTFACELLKDIGYFTAPVMCWFMTEGYRYTHSVKRYAMRLLFFAGISQIPYYMAFGRNRLAPWYTLNMLVTLSLCLGILYVEDKIYDPAVKSVSVLGMICASAICDWAVLAPVYTMLFWKAGQNKERQKRAFRIAALLIGGALASEPAGAWTPVIVLGGMASVLAAGGCVLYLYNGKRSETCKTFSKWFFYVFYPAHLLILAMLKV